MYWTVWLSRATLAPMAASPYSPRAKAYGALVLTAVLWGSSAVTARGLLDGLTPAALAALRWIVVLAALLPFVWRERAAIASAYSHDFRALAVFALVGFAPQTYLIYLGLVGSSAINLGLLNSAIPVLIVVVAARAPPPPPAPARADRPRALARRRRRDHRARPVVDARLARVQRPRPGDAARHGRVGVLHGAARAARRRAVVPGVHVRRPACSASR